MLVALLVTTGVYKVQTENYNINNDINQSANINNQNVNENIYVNQPEEIKSEPIILKATAYTKSAEEQTKKGITKSGTKVSRGTVSVDPKTIPLGTKLYIEGYGYAVALDTGGDIKQDRIDLYMETKKEAFEFGRQDVRVWIIE